MRNMKGEQTSTERRTRIRRTSMLSKLVLGSNDVLERRVARLCWRLFLVYLFLQLWAIWEVVSPSLAGLGLKW